MQLPQAGSCGPTAGRAARPRRARRAPASRRASSLRRAPDSPKVVQDGPWFLGGRRMLARHLVSRPISLVIGSHRVAWRDHRRGCCAAGRGTTTRGTCASRTATTTTRRMRTTMSGFGWCGWRREHWKHGVIPIARVPAFLTREAAGSARFPVQPGDRVAAVGPRAKKKASGRAGSASERAAGCRLSLRSVVHRRGGRPHRRKRRCGLVPFGVSGQPSTGGVLLTPSDEAGPGFQHPRFR